MSAFADQFSLQENGRNVKDFLKKTENQKTAVITPVRLKLRFQVMYALCSEWHCDFYFFSLPVCCFEASLRNLTPTLNL